MKFRFDVNITDKDYFDYNYFWAVKSPYGKKIVAFVRILVSAVIAFLLLVSCFGFTEGFTLDAFLGVLPLLIFLVLFNVFLNKLFWLILLIQMKLLKKKGRMGYSPTSVMEFYEDYFVETTADSQTENKYTAVERISVLTGKMMYIHVNNVMCFMLPYSAFESQERYREFLEFINTKCNNIDFY